MVAVMEEAPTSCLTLDGCAMAALQAYLMELKWDACELSGWVRAQLELLPALNVNLDFHGRELQDAQSSG